MPCPKWILFRSRPETHRTAWFEKGGAERCRSDGASYSDLWRCFFWRSERRWRRCLQCVGWTAGKLFPWSIYIWRSFHGGLYRGVEWFAANAGWPLTAVFSRRIRLSGGAVRSWERHIRYRSSGRSYSAHALQFRPGYSWWAAVCQRRADEAEPDRTADGFPWSCRGKVRLTEGRAKGERQAQTAYGDGRVQGIRRRTRRSPAEGRDGTEGYASPW